MATGLRSSHLHVVIGKSLRLRDEVLNELIGQWKGPVKRVVEPADLERVALDLDTASLFEEPALWLVRADGRYLRKHAETLSRLTTAGPVTAQGGCLVLTLPGLDRVEKGSAGPDPLAAVIKALKQAEAWHGVDVPTGKELSGWLFSRLNRHPQGVEHPGQVAEALIDHLGEDADALLSAIDTLAIYADEDPITLEAVEAVITGIGSRPIWEFTSAILEGKIRRAIELLHAGGGFEPQQALGALTNELRKLIACCETKDDGQVCKWIGTKGSPNLYYARRRSSNLGKAGLQRLLQECQLVQRQMRQGGANQELAVECLVLHAQKVVQPSGR
jgi:DNA polymerase III delta subunit